MKNLRKMRGAFWIIYSRDGKDICRLQTVNRKEFARMSKRYDQELFLYECINDAMYRRAVSFCGEVRLV